MSQPPPLAADFPPLDRAAWLEHVGHRDPAALALLGSRTDDGIELRPLYLPEDDLPESARSFPGLPPFLRGAHAAGATRTGWDLRTVRAESEAAACNTSVLEDLAGGATAIELRIAAPGVEEGLHLRRLADLERALDGVEPRAIALALDAGAGFGPAAAALVAWLRRRGSDLVSQRASLGADPLGALARSGVLPQGAGRALHELADLAAYTNEELPAAAAVRADGSVYHDAGATDAQELACVLAAGVAYLRAMTEHDLELEAAFRQVELAFSIDSDLFGGISKLRAARRLWWRVAESCGVRDPRSAAPRIHARAARRACSPADPPLDVLRATAAAFAAAAGGAQSISTEASSLGRRLARNTQLVLAEEAHLHRVIDPGGGSWYLEHRTEALCERAWELFRDYERRGGLLAIFGDGSLQRELAAAAESRRREIAERRVTLVGVNRFAVLGPAPAARPAEPAESAALVSDGESTIRELVARWLSEETFASSPAGGAESVEAMPLRPLGRDFAELRAASDRLLAETGSRPRVLVAKLGTPREAEPRADWTRDLLAAGGLATLEHGPVTDPFELAAAFRASGAAAVVLCSSDERYVELGEAAMRALRDAGARLVLGAGGRDPELERRLAASGIDGWLREGADALGPLRRIWAALRGGPAARDGAAESTRDGEEARA